MAAVKKGSSGVLERVPSAGPGIRSKPKGAPVRGLHPNSSPVYKTQSDSGLTSGLKNLSINNDTKRSLSSRTGSSSSKVRSLQDVAGRLQGDTVKNVVLVAGAGISTPSGIPDFRSPGTGLYDNLQQYQIPYPEAIFDIDYFFVNPRPFFTLAKELYPSGKYRPNYIHYFARLLHDKGMLLRMYTQNIDGLERLAGVPAEKLVEAHGTFATATCTVCRHKMPGPDIKEKIFSDKLPRCPTRGCIGIVKPDIVFFGEDLPRKFYSYMKDMLQTDLVIVLGTSLEVQPFAGIIDTVRPTVPRVLFNREAVGPFKYNRRSQDVVAAGDLIDNMVKFSTMVGWKEDMVNLITKEEGEFKIAKKPIQPKKVSFDSKTGKKINNPPPSVKKPTPNQRNYSNLAYQRRTRVAYSSDSSSDDGSTDSDVTSSDSSEEEVNRIRKFKGLNRGKFGNTNGMVKNGATNTGIRNGFRSSSAKLGDTNTRKFHTDSNSKGSRTVNGSFTGRSVKSESGLNENAKRRLDTKIQNKVQDNNSGNKSNISVSEKNRVLRKYGLSPGPKVAPKETNILEEMQKPVRAGIKNGKNGNRELKAKPTLVIRKTTEETNLSDGNQFGTTSIRNDLNDGNSSGANSIRNDLLQQAGRVVREMGKEEGTTGPEPCSAPIVPASLPSLTREAETGGVEAETGRVEEEADQGEEPPMQPMRVEIGIRRESPLTDLRKDQYSATGYFIDESAKNLSEEQNNYTQSDKHIPQEQDKHLHETNNIEIACNAKNSGQLLSLELSNENNHPVSQNITTNNLDTTLAGKNSLADDKPAANDTVENLKLYNRVVETAENLDKNSGKMNDRFSDTLSVTSYRSQRSQREMSNKVAESFAKYANIQSQRQVVGRGDVRPHRKPVNAKPPTGKNTSKLTDLSKLNTRAYGYAYRQKMPVRGIGPFHRIDVRTLSSSIDFTQEPRAGSAELPKLNYRHNIEPVTAYDAGMFGFRTRGDSNDDTFDAR